PLPRPSPANSSTPTSAANPASTIASNTYSGGTTLVGGTLAIASHNNIGGTTTPITFNGGLLRLNGIGITSLSAHTINWSTFNGGLDIADPAHTFTLGTVIGGTSFTKAGSGTLVLSATNTHTVGTTITGGVLSVTNTAQLGATNAPLNLSGGTLRLTTGSTSTLARTTTLTNASSIDITQAAAVITMSQPIGGTGSITKLGLGKLVLGAANTYTGQTTISAGIVQITHANALQNSTVNLAGGTLDLNGLAASVGGLAGTGTVDVKGTKLTLGASNQDSTFAGNITSSIGVGSVEKVGTGAIDLTGTNTYTGGTTLTAGTLGITNDTDIGNTATSAITFQGGRLRINGTTLTSMGTHVVNWSTFNGGFDIADAAHTFTVSSVIGGIGSFTKAGAGVLVLSGANTFSGGTILKTGTLSISSDTAGTSHLGGTTRAVTFDGGILRITGSAIANLNTHAVNWSTFNGGINVDTAAHTFTISQVLGGAGSLTKAGAGTLALSSANTFTGDTNLSAGILRLTNADALQNSNLVPGGGVIDLASVTSGNIGGLKGSGAWNLSGETVNVGNNNQNTNYSGVLSSSVAGAAFNKIGTGTLTLSGANSFTGPITIKNGAISISSIAAAGTNSPLGPGGTAGAASASTLVIDGGTLQYNGGGASTNDRLFSVGPNGGLVECAGAGLLKFTNAGAIGMTGTGDRTLTFGGVNSDCEMKFAIGDPSVGKTSLRKIDGGRWIMTQTSPLTYSGDTIIEAGILIPTAATNILPHGAGKGNLVMDEGQFEMNGRDLTINGLIGGGNINNRTSTKLLTIGDGTLNGSVYDFYGTISNGGGTVTNVTKIGSGTQIFTGRNRYQGTTTVSGGVLQVNGAHDFNHTGYLVTSGKLEVGDAISATATPAPLTATGAGIIDLNAGSSFRASTVNSTTTILNDGALSTGAGGAIPGITGVGTLIATGGTLTSATGIRQGSISLSGNATIAVTTNGFSTGVTKVNAVNIASDGGTGYAGTLQLNDNDLVIDYTASTTSYATTLAMVKKGLTVLGGNGKGIASAAVDGGSSGKMLGVIDGGATGGVVTSLSGFTIPNPSASVLVKYTWRGDINLDGVVNGSDYALADTGFSGGGTGGWFYGDVNYDGVVNGSDYALIDTGFSSQTGPLPEPAMLGALGMAAMGLLRRRRS
ncbi:MAG: autotransporter-associated beta strand repeat-containing protein, partial [Burkholderiales bacterium]|nr:autotransporter-associated beta strand repeat-containing protein [Phycisphaerae bacterium]